MKWAFTLCPLIRSFQAESVFALGWVRPQRILRVADIIRRTGKKKRLFWDGPKKFSRVDCKMPKPFNIPLLRSGQPEIKDWKVFSDGIRYSKSRMSSLNILLSRYPEEGCCVTSQNKSEGNPHKSGILHSSLVPLLYIHCTSSAGPYWQTAPSASTPPSASTRAPRGGARVALMTFTAGRVPSDFVDWMTMREP